MEKIESENIQVEEGLLRAVLTQADEGGTLWAPSPGGAQWMRQGVGAQTDGLQGLAFPPFRVRYSTSIHSTQGSVNATNSKGYYSRVGKVRGIPGRRVTLDRWGSEIWARRMSDHGDKRKAGTFWDF